MRRNTRLSVIGHLTRDGGISFRYGDENENYVRPRLRHRGTSIM